MEADLQVNGWMRDAGRSRGLARSITQRIFALSDAVNRFEVASAKLGDAPVSVKPAPQQDHVLAALRAQRLSHVQAIKASEVNTLGMTPDMSAANDQAEID